MLVNRAEKVVASEKKAEQKPPEKQVREQTVLEQKVETVEPGHHEQFAVYH